MLWEQLDPTAQSILLNFQQLVFDSIYHTNPNKTYYCEEKDGAFYFSTEVKFPLMNGVIDFSSDPKIIDIKCELLKNRFSELNCPVTWFWPHDMDLPQDVDSVFAKHKFQSMGKYTSMAVSRDEVKKISNAEIQIKQVMTDTQFQQFMQITKEVYGMSEDSLAAMTHFYGAYKTSSKIKLYIAEIDNLPVATLLSFNNQNVLGLYNGATLEQYRKRGLLTALIARAINDAETADLIVVQLMAKQNALGVCEKLGFKTYATFTPLCYGFDVDSLSA